MSFMSFTQTPERGQIHLRSRTLRPRNKERRWPIAVSPIVLLALAGSAAADPDPDPEASVVAAAPAPEARSPQLVYVEVLGKAGAYGVGYEHGVTERIALGVEGSYTQLRAQELATAVPYLHVTPLRRGANALYGELGVELTYSQLVSAVPRWMGTTSSGIGAVASVGYERSWKHLVLRGAVSMLAGKGGMAPWAGLAIGVKP